ncbi:MAG: hypothetical protein ABH983_02880 [Candidatus Micrarchaeota archaeon]
MDLINTNEYKNAKAKITSWMKDLDVAKKDDILRMRDEKAEFFKKMNDTNPELYSAFHVNDNELSRKIHKKLTGRDVIID